MAFRWEALAEQTSERKEVWAIMQFDEPASQESIERAHLRAYCQNYTYTVTHPRCWGTLERE